MIKFLKKIIMRVLYPHTYSSDALIKFIRKRGGVIGEHTYIYKSYKARIDINNARFISIGNNCLITEGCVILAHDYSYAVVANEYGELLRNQRKTSIGNNVFLGMNTIVLMGASIGNNCIIGAGIMVS